VEQINVTTPDGVRLSAVAAGPPGGPPVLLLHGFPEGRDGWRHQLGPLAAAGFRVVAPEQRGYARSDKPPRVREYAIDRLVADALAVLDHVGAETAAVVGHDWGGGVAWRLAQAHPERVRKLVVINCPHPAAMRHALLTNPAQLMRSWYVFAAQVPGLPELASAATGHRLLARSMRRTSRPGTFSDAELDEYRRQWATPGAVRGMVNWYRAAVRHRPADAGRRVAVPTLLLWGERDAFLHPSLAAASAAFCDDVRVDRHPAATHWVTHEEPGWVNERIAGFVRG
jgi:pimeloyl-ACP methyl ester carboxylesterase